MTSTIRKSNGLNELDPKILEKFLKYSKVKYHRYQSWKHCYLHFQNLHKKKTEITKDECDLASLNLAMYLASWGMFRGSTISLQLDYKFYCPIVKVLLNENYNELWNLNTEIEKYKNGDKVKNIQYTFVKLRDELNGKLEKCLSDYKENLKKYMCEDTIKSENFTSTFISKVLLGTIGCIPAYDNYFKKGLVFQEVKIAKSIKNKNLLSSLIEYYYVNKNLINNKIKDLYKEEKIRYPIMKIIDSYFWQVGYEQYLKNQAEKNKGF
jgi:hypothetical protein